MMGKHNLPFRSPGLVRRLTHRPREKHRSPQCVGRERLIVSQVRPHLARYPPPVNHPRDHQLSPLWAHYVASYGAVGTGRGLAM
jgi:hypothetical protein